MFAFNILYFFIIILKAYYLYYYLIVLFFHSFCSILYKIRWLPATSPSTATDPTTIATTLSTFMLLSASALAAAEACLSDLPPIAIHITLYRYQDTGIYKNYILNDLIKKNKWLSNYLLTYFVTLLKPL